MFKLRWLRDQRKKEMVKGMLAAECHKLIPRPGPVQQAAKMPVSPTTPDSSSYNVQDLFCFEEADDTFSTVETEVMTYLRTAVTGMEILKQFPTIKDISLKKNAATPSSAPVERLLAWEVWYCLQRGTSCLTKGLRDFFSCGTTTGLKDHNA
ncbi:unnamed protein product [Leuciscus chuanchicus]